MIKPTFPIARVALSALGISLCLPSAKAQGYYPTVHEPFDLNATGNLIGQDAKGYGLSGKYAAFGATDASAFQVVTGGLPFAPFNSATGNSLRVTTQTTGTGIGALIDGGKVFGSPYPEFYNILYTSYLIKFSSVTTNAAGRAGVRVNNTATATTGFRFQVSADAGTASSLQPSVAYNDTPVSLGTAGSLQANVVYMLIGRFTNVGNALAASPADGNGTIYALTLAQYGNFRVAANPQTFLDTMAIGMAATNVSVRLSTTTGITTGNFPFGHGRAMQILAQGATGSAQTFDIDEIRYGDTLRSVALPTALRPAGPVAQAVDTFTETPMQGYPDGGSGWKSNWYEIAENAATLGAFGTVYGTPSIANSGSFLQVYNYDAGAGDQGIRRKPDPAFVDMTQPYTTSFDFRTDEGFVTVTGGTFTSYNDRIHFGADVDGTAFGTSATMSWLIGVVGGPNGSTPYYNGQWYFFNNPDSAPGAFLTANMVNTGVPLLEQCVFRFVIEVDPPNKRYKATITNLDTGATFSAANLGFRNKTSNSTTLLLGTVKSGTEQRFFGLDNVLLKQGIPDPYLTWLDSFPAITQAADKLRTADYDKDGGNNFLEYALDGNPASPTNDGKLVPVIKDISGTNYYTLTIPVRTGVEFTGTTGPRVSNIIDALQYRIEGSYDMASFTADVIEIPAPTGLPTLSTTPGYVYKSFRLGASVAAQPKGFLRAVIINQ